MKKLIFLIILAPIFAKAGCESIFTTGDTFRTELLRFYRNQYAVAVTRHESTVSVYLKEYLIGKEPNKIAPSTIINLASIFKEEQNVAAAIEVLKGDPYIKWLEFINYYQVSPVTFFARGINEKVPFKMVLLLMYFELDPSIPNSHKTVIKELYLRMFENKMALENINKALDSHPESLAWRTAWSMAPSLLEARKNLREFVDKIAADHKEYFSVQSFERRSRITNDEFEMIKNIKRNEPSFTEKDWRRQEDFLLSLRLKLGLSTGYTPKEVYFIVLSLNEIKANEGSETIKAEDEGYESFMVRIWGRDEEKKAIQFLRQIIEFAEKREALIKQQNNPDPFSI